MAIPVVRPLPSRTERTIVVARLVMAASSLFAVWLDPTEPDRYLVPTYTLHSIYLVYAVSLAAMSWDRAASDRWMLVTHLGDIFVCALFQYLSLGPSSSPFFTYFVFSLFCAALRWGWRGTLRTAGLVLVLFLLMGVSVGLTFAPADFDLNRYVTRAFYLTVVAGLLMYLGQHEGRLRRDLERLAHWPSSTGSLGDVLNRVLGHAAATVGAGRARLAWERDDEPWTHVAAWSAGTLTLARYGPGEHEVAPVSAEDGAVSAAFTTEHVSGQVSFSDLQAPTAELMLLTEVVTREIGNSIEQLSISEHLRELAVGEQRLQVARDLHDGVLQSLTGIRLELQDVAADTSVASTEQRDRLRGIERALAMEQRELRLFIEHLKPHVESPMEDHELMRTLDALRERVALEWKVPLTIRVAPQVASVPAAIGRAVPPMVHEAVVNALKHGEPSRIWVDVEAHDDVLHIVVGDDGHGFPFRGRYDHTALERGALGPASLRDRTASLGGRLTIESEGTGSRVEIALPIGAA